MTATRTRLLRDSREAHGADGDGAVMDWQALHDFLKAWNQRCRPGCAWCAKEAAG